MRVISAQQLEWTGETNTLGDSTAPFPYVAGFEIAGICFELRSDVAGLTEEFSVRFGDHVTQQDPQFTYSVTRTDEGYNFSCPHDGVWRWLHGELPVSGVAFLADAAVMSALVHFDPALCSMHAAAVSDGEKAAAIVGDSTAGKTTTLLACGRAELAVYSDERALLRHGMVHPFLRRCRVRADGAARLLGDADGDALARHLQGRTELSLREVLGAERIARTGPLRAVFVLDGYADAPGLRRIESAQAIPAIIRWFDARGDAFDRLARLVALLRATACFKLVLGTPAASAATIARALRELR